MSNTNQTKLSRRKFLRAGAALTFVVVLDPFGCKRKVKPEPSATTEAGGGAADPSREAVGAWVTINSDDTVVILNPAAEMGQGSMTALPVILAEEMDANWDKVEIENSPVDLEVYGRGWGRGTGGGSMATVGSRAVMGYFLKLRLAGAQIRRALLAGAATSLAVPVDELTTEAGVVIHAKSGRRMSYGEIAAAGTVPDELPEVSERDLKSPEDFRIIGISVPRTDIPAKTDGTAQFAIDVDLPELRYAMIVRSPVPNGEVASHNAEEVRAFDGVDTTVELGHGVGIIGESIEAVIAARRKLEVKWAAGNKAANFHSENELAGYPKLVGRNAQSMGRKGDAKSAIENASKRYSADYFADHVYHAQMEPLNAVASVKPSGDAEVWIGTQAPGRARGGVANALGVDVERVTVHRCFLGGGFGRRSSDDYVVEAALLSNAIKKPVKLIWTREDDLRYGKFRPMCLQRMTAGVDANGKLTSWEHNLVGEGGHLLGSGVDIPYYDVPNQQIDLVEVDHGLRIHYWRAVGHGYNKFAIEAFLDEVAAGQQIDPVEFRRALVSTERARKVLEAVAKMSDWGNVAEGRAKGIALAERSGTMAGGVAEISVDEERGKIRVHRFWAALDAGIIVQPDNASAQIEGSIVMALGTTLTERITFVDGQVQQSNYSDYAILRMSDAPEIEVQFLKSGAEPSGIGEPGVPIVTGAVANAFASLTGKRLRHMPFTRARVKAALS